MLKKQTLIIIIALLLMSFFPHAHPSRVPLLRLLNGWTWLLRLNPQLRTLQFHFLIQTDYPDVGEANTLLLHAIPFPGGAVSIGANIHQVRSLGWRTQPESTVLLHNTQHESGYMVQESGYDPQIIQIYGISDLRQLASCLAGAGTPRAPLYMSHTHSFTGVLNGLLSTGFRRGLLTPAQFEAVFDPSIASGQYLSAHAIYNPDNRGRQVNKMRADTDRH